MHPLDDRAGPAPARGAAPNGAAPEAAAEAPVGFSSLEESLLGTDGPQILAARLTWVAETRKRVNAWLSTGVTAADHAEARAVLAALDAAERILMTSTQKGRETRHGHSYLP
jgi:hypothetical protein